MNKGIFWTKIAICALVTYVNWYLHTVIILVIFLCVFVLFWLWCMEHIVFLSWVCELLIRQTATTIVASECSKYSHMSKKYVVHGCHGNNMLYKLFWIITELCTVYTNLILLWDFPSCGVGSGSLVARVSPGVWACDAFLRPEIKEQVILQLWSRQLLLTPWWLSKQPSVHV